MVLPPSMIEFDAQIIPKVGLMSFGDYCSAFATPFHAPLLQRSMADCHTLTIQIATRPERGASFSATIPMGTKVPIGPLRERKKKWSSTEKYFGKGRWG